MRPILTALMVVCAVLAMGPAVAQARFTPEQRAEIIAIIREALRSDPSLLRDAITALQEDEGRRQGDAARAAIAESQQALLRTQGDPVAGNPNGDVTVVEFYDIRCPYCRRMVPVVAELLRADAKVRFVYKDFPILGPGSVTAARAVLAAHKQGGYLKMHAALMSGPANLDTEALRAATQRAGLDWERLQRDMGDPEIQARITANLALGKKLEIQGTPAYVIGDRMLPGAVGLPDLMEAVAEARRK